MVSTCRTRTSTLANLKKNKNREDSPPIGEEVVDDAEEADDPKGSQVAEDEDSKEESLGSQEETDEEAVREAAIQESIRKLRELEADRPLWEEQARRRRLHEEEEKREIERRNAKKNKEQQRRAEEESAKARADDARRVENEAIRSRQEREQKRQAALQQAKIERKRHKHGPWTAQNAITRYQQLSERFDKTNYHAGEILIFDHVPWPTLARPGTYAVEDIDWKSTEDFFREAKGQMRDAEYRKLVERSHKRFHPDRWRSRRVLQTVDDLEEKVCLEAAATTVAQALTPLWAAVSGR